MLGKASIKGVPLPKWKGFSLPLVRGGFIQRRLLFLGPQLVAVSVITFILIRMLPGNPAVQLLGPLSSPEAVEALEERLGLNDPLPIQYFKYVSRVVQGDLGDSWFTSNPVSQDLVERLPATLELITLALVVSLLIMVPLGISVASPSQSGIRAIFDKGFNRIVALYSLLAGSLADFWLALILIFIFFFKLGIAPTPIGALDLGVTQPDKVTGFLTIDSIIAGNFEALRSYLSHLFLPVATLVFVYGGPILKMTIVAMQDIQQSPYLENARAMGLKTSTLRRIAFRNALPPIITMVGVIYGFLLGGAVLVETIFGLNGVGAYGVNAVVQADFAPVQGFVLVAAVWVMAVYLIVDILHAISDPRIRL